MTQLTLDFAAAPTPTPIEVPATSSPAPFPMAPPSDPSWRPHDQSRPYPDEPFDWLLRTDGTIWTRPVPARAAA